MYTLTISFFIRISDKTARENHSGVLDQIWIKEAMIAEKAWNKSSKAVKNKIISINQLKHSQLTFF